MSDVLAIEDNRIFVDLLRAMLPRARIARVPRLSAALLIMQTHVFDLILLDLDLLDSVPENTIATIPQIKKLAGPKARLVVLTAMDGFDRQLRGMGVEVKNKADFDYQEELPVLLRRLLGRTPWWKRFFWT